MSSRKITTKQERFDFVAHFLKSGQSHMVWCQENGIKPNTLYRWRMEYKTMQQDVCFVSLRSKSSKSASSSHKEEAISNVLFEFGSCKVHVSEHMAMSLLTEVLKQVVDTHV